MDVIENIDEDAILDTDYSIFYTILESLVNEHWHKVIPEEEIGKMLPWVHIAISNAKRLLLSTFYRYLRENLQNYLNEFCYKFIEHIPENICSQGCCSRGS